MSLSDQLLVDLAIAHIDAAIAARYDRDSQAVERHATRARDYLNQLSK